MSCCGNKRAALIQSSTGSKTSGKPLPVKIWSDIHFENLSNTPVTVSGQMTGKRYHWSARGALQSVDFRDAEGLKHYAVMKKVR